MSWKEAGKCRGVFGRWMTNVQSSDATQAFKNFAKM